MMVQAGIELFHRLVPLFETDVPNAPLLFSTLEGKSPGVAFVDSTDKPTACILLMEHSNAVFVGRGVQQEFLDTVTRQLRSEKAILLVWPPGLSQRLAPPSLPTTAIDRVEFVSRGTAKDSSASLDWPVPEDCDIRRTDAALFRRCLWYEFMLPAFGSVEGFLEHGLGFCLLRGDEILSEVYGVIGNGQVELGTMTNELHRRQGHATAVCARLIGECEDQGLKPYWSCNMSNPASIALAQKLGFREQRSYKLLYYAQAE